MLNENIKFREVTTADAELLHTWRNHPEVRSVSTKNTIIKFTDHYAWIQKIIKDKNRWLFVGEIGNIPIGCIRFDQTEKNKLSVSLYLDPSLNNLGLGQHLLNLGELEMKKILKGNLIFTSEIMPSNILSQNLFKKCGYQGGPIQYYKSY